MVVSLPLARDPFDCPSLRFSVKPFPSSFGFGLSGDTVLAPCARSSFVLFNLATCALGSSPRPFYCCILWLQPLWRYNVGLFFLSRRTPSLDMAHCTASASRLALWVTPFCLGFDFFGGATSATSFFAILGRLAWNSPRLRFRAVFFTFSFGLSEVILGAYSSFTKSPGSSPLSHLDCLSVRVGAALSGCDSGFSVGS